MAPYQGDKFIFLVTTVSKKKQKIVKTSLSDKENPSLKAIDR